jgi:glycosyltransferase involved in cell wall biosynthesis
MYFNDKTPVITINILLVPMSDWVHHPLASRLHFIFELLAKKNHVNVLWFKMKNWDETPKRDTAAKLHNATFISSNDLSTYYVLNAPYHYRMIEKIISSESIDIVVIANILAGTQACIAAKRKGLPIIFDYSDHYPDSATLYYKNPVVKILVKMAVKKIVNKNLNYADKVVVVSKSFAHLVKNEYGVKNKKIVLIPNGVDTQRFKPRSKDAALEKLSLRHLKDHFLLVYVGSLEPRFDLETPIHAVNKLWREGLKVKLLIIGPELSDNYKYLKKRYSKLSSIEFVGYVANDLVPYYVNAADVCLAPYRTMTMNYGITLKVLEYLASGKVTLVTRIPDIIKTFGDSVIEYRDENDLVKKIRSAYISLDKYVQSTQKGYEIAKCYSWDNFARTYEELMCTLSLHSNNGNI